MLLLHLQASVKLRMEAAAAEMQRALPREARLGAHSGPLLEKLARERLTAVFEGHQPTRPGTAAAGLSLER